MEKLADRTIQRVVVELDCEPYPVVAPKRKGLSNHSSIVTVVLILVSSRPIPVIMVLTS